MIKKVALGLGTQWGHYGGTTIFSEAFILNDDGTRASATESQLQPDGSTLTTSTTWTYDQDGRLTSETATFSDSADSSDAPQNYSDVYTYDLGNNRMSDVHVDGSGTQTTAYSYNGDDELIHFGPDTTGDGLPDPATETTNAYDANGSLIKTTDASGNVTLYTYDARNKMVEYSDSSTTASYVYDDAGNRVQETVGTTTTYYLTDTQNPTGYAQPLEQKISPTAVPSVTYFLGDRIIAQADGIGNVTVLLPDGHGSTEQLANSSGTVTAAFQYDAFGDALNFTPASAGTVFLFGGDAVYDPASGLYFHGDGVRQRLGFLFIERDTFAGTMQDPLSLHKYLYAEANPVDANDPSGQFVGLLTSAADEADEVANEAAEAEEGGSIAGEVVGEIESEQEVDLGLESAEDEGANSTIANQEENEVLESQEQTAEEGEEGENDEGEEDGGLPVFDVHYSLTPWIALHDQLAIGEGHPDVLNYNGPGSGLTALNRAAALAGYVGSKSATLNSLDEYPFASTAQGGAGASVAPVPLIENRIQGTQLSVFYAQHGYVPGFQFQVKVVP